MSAAWSYPEDSKFYPKRTLADFDKAEQELAYWRKVEGALGETFTLHGWTGTDRAAFWAGHPNGYKKPIEITKELANRILELASPGEV